jgi:hypothetical protein
VKTTHGSCSTLVPALEQLENVDSALKFPKFPTAICNSSSWPLCLNKISLNEPGHVHVLANFLLILLATGGGCIAVLRLIQLFHLCCLIIHR